MKALLDTNALLWSAFSPRKLSPKAAAAFRETRALHFSVVSLWEIGLKLSRGGHHDFALPDDWEVMIPHACRNQNIGILHIEPGDCRIIQDLPFHHRDPFDRMLAAQAMRAELAIVSPDRIFDSYGTRRIW